MRTFIVTFIFILTPVVNFAQGISGTWSTASSNGLGWGRGLNANVIGGKIFVTGGGADSAYEYNPLTDSWTVPKAKGTCTRREFGTSSVVNNKIYVIGGGDYNFKYLNTLEVFDPSTNSWTTPVTTGYIKPCYEAASGVVNEKIYFIAGKTQQNDTFGISKNISVFDPAINNWTSPNTTGTYTPRSGVSISVVENKIYVFGGWDSTGKATNKLEVFDPQQHSWTTPSTTGTPYPRVDFTSDVIDGKIFVFGGSGPGQYTLEVFDPATNVWSTVKTTGIYTPRYGLASTTLYGKIYAIGGCFGMNLNTNEIFTLNTNNVEISSKKPGINIFPNPAVGKIIIYSIPQSTIQITDITGRILRSIQSQSDQEEVDLSKFPNGTYFVKTTDSKGNSSTAKFVKE